MAFLLRGLICGPFYGALIGFIAPLLRSALFGMPPIMPTATAMAFELMTYGLVYSRVRQQSVKTVYLSLITAMLAGRCVWGLVMMILMDVQGSAFTFSAFLAGAFTNAVPGIVLQLIFIPCIMAALNRSAVLQYRSASEI
jgi:LytS/YehU family sensor histidine kinase